MFEYFGVVAVLLTWVIGGFITWRWRIDNSKSISEHAASHRVAFVLCGVILSVIGPVFYIWILQYLVPKLDLGTPFVVVLTIAISLQFLTGLVPDKIGWQRIAHRTTAYGMAVSFSPLSLMITFAANPWSAAFWSGIVYACYAVLGWFLFAFVPKSRKNYLIFQSLYVVFFQLQILVSAYS